MPLVPFASLPPGSLEWPLGEDMIIPIFPHEKESMYLISLSTPVFNLGLDSAHLVWIRDNDRNEYRMVRVLADGKKHGEEYDEHNVPTGRVFVCPCVFCSCVAPVAITCA